MNIRVAGAKGKRMRACEKRDCEELLCDLICYEMRCGRLSPEMQYMLEEHLVQCPNCRNRMVTFSRMVDLAALARNFG